MLLFQLVFSIAAMVAENANRRREEVDRMARRLCSAKSDKLVAAPAIDAGGYHVFLSHVVSWKIEPILPPLAVCRHIHVLTRLLALVILAVCAPLSGAMGKIRCG